MIDIYSNVFLQSDNFFLKLEKLLSKRNMLVTGWRVSNSTLVCFDYDVKAFIISANWSAFLVVLRNLS